MAFTRITSIETAEQEQERLSRSPEGSINHALSQLPVTNPEPPQDLLIQLPWVPPRTSEPYTIVVVPYEFRKDLHQGERSPRHLYSGSWACIVVASDHPKYPVGGYRITVTSAELARGTRVETIATTQN